MHRLSDAAFFFDCEVCAIDPEETEEMILTRWAVDILLAPFGDELASNATSADLLSRGSLMYAI